MSGASVVIEALGRASCQGGLALFLVWAFCRLLPRLPGRTQSWLWRLAYLKLLVALLWATPLELPLLSAASRRSPAVSAKAPDARRQTPVTGREVAVALQPSAAHPTANPGRSTTAGVWRLASGAFSCLLLLWLLGASWFTLRVGSDWRRTQRLRRRGIALRDETLVVACRALCRRLGVRREPALLTASELDCPVLVGVARPAIVLPESFPARFPLAQLRLMLAHELAHLQRRDLLWAWLPSLGRVLFFFHPLVWLAEGEWRLAQEMACDELVVRSTGISHAGYGAMLLEVVGQPGRPAPAGLLTVGVAESYTTLRRRLAAIRQIPVAGAGEPQRGSGDRSEPTQGGGRQRQRRHWMVQALATVLLVGVGAGGLIPWRLTAAPAHPPQTSDRQARSGGVHEIQVAGRAFPSLSLVRIQEVRQWSAGPAKKGPSPDQDRFSRAPARRQHSWAAAERARWTRVAAGSDRSQVSGGEGRASGRGTAWASIRDGRGSGMPRQQHRAVKESLSGTSQIGKAATGTTRRLMILAEIPPKPADPVPDSASQTEPLDQQLAGVKTPDSESSRMLLVAKEQVNPDTDPLSRDLDPMAFDSGIAHLKQARATRTLLVTKPVAAGFSLFRWKPSPLFRRPNGPEVGIDPSVDPARLRRLLGEASQQGLIDPGEIKRLLSKAVQQGGIDPGALKKMLAQAHWKEDGEASLFEQKGLTSGMRLPFDPDLDQQKRLMEKLQRGSEMSGKPFVGIAPDF